MTLNSIKVYIFKFLSEFDIEQIAHAFLEQRENHKSVCKKQNPKGTSRNHFGADVGIE